MKVCLLNDSFPPMLDGVANTVQNYASVMKTDELADVVVVTPAYPDADYSIYPYKIYPYTSFNISELIYGYRAGNPLARRALVDIRRFSPDIIHTHCPFASTLMARLARVETRAPIVFTYHTKFEYDICKTLKKKFLRREAVNLVINNISACDEVWTVSRGAGEDLKAIGFKGEYRVMQNGVDFEKGRVSDELVREVTGGLDLPEDVPVFLFVGRLIDYKGLPLIAEALKMLSAEGIDYRMVFVGGGLDRKGLEERIRESGISVLSFSDEDGWSSSEGAGDMTGKVIFTGPIRERDALRAWNTRADLFIFPSTYDTNGIVVREAAACGTASVMIKGSCAAEGVTDRRNAYLIDEDAASLYELLKAVAPDLNGMRITGENAMEEIYLSWDEAVRNAVNRYGELLEERRTSKSRLASSMETVGDVLSEMKAGLVSETRRLFSIPRTIYAGMLSNSGEETDELEDGGSGMKDLINDLSDEE